MTERIPDMTILGVAFKYHVRYNIECIPGEM